MDTALRLTHDALAARTRRFFTRYLHRAPQRPEHLTFLFYDRALPPWFVEGLAAVEATSLTCVDMNRCGVPGEILASARAQGRYVSAHEYVVDNFSLGERSILRLARAAEDMDYTSFEFPRYDVSDEQMAELLRRFVSSNLDEQVRVTHRFYELLARATPYTIRVLSGPGHELVIESDEPWMELSGPLCAGNIRFAPGAEIFSRGRGASGWIRCSGALNVLPLRAHHVERALCEDLLGLGKRLAEEPVDIHIEGGCITAVASEGTLGREVETFLARDPAFSSLVEVGIGLSPEARPLVTQWAASSNEAVPGLHVGLGADPSDTGRFKTLVHADFVCDDVVILVNDQVLFTEGRFA